MGVARIFRKFSKNVLRKFRKMHYFRIRNFKISQENREKCIILAYFSKNLTNHALIFGAFGRKTQFVGNFEKIFKKFI